MTFSGLYQEDLRRKNQLYLLAKAGESVDLRPEDSQLYLQATLLFRQGQYRLAKALLQAIDTPDSEHHLLLGQLEIALGSFETAITHLLLAEPDYPKEAIPLLEQCYREQEDFKMAYTYALKLREN